MKERILQIIYDAWLEDHIDTDSIKDIWKKVACKLPPKDTEALNIYAEALEQQAFHFGFAAGVAMMIECVSLCYPPFNE